MVSGISMVWTHYDTPLLQPIELLCNRTLVQHFYLRLHGLLCIDTQREQSVCVHEKQWPKKLLKSAPSRHPFLQGARGIGARFLR
jgi:hypothetical protein